MTTIKERGTGFSTKYALTTGIEEVRVESSGDEGRWLYGTVRTSLGVSFYSDSAREGVDIFNTYAEAREKQKEMARRKIKSIGKQLKKMQALLDD